MRYDMIYLAPDGGAVYDLVISMANNSDKDDRRYKGDKAVKNVTAGKGVRPLGAGITMAAKPVSTSLAGGALTLDQLADRLNHQLAAKNYAVAIILWRQLLRALLVMTNQPVTAGGNIKNSNTAYHAEWVRQAMGLAEMATDQFYLRTAEQLLRQLLAMPRHMVAANQRLHCHLLLSRIGQFYDDEAMMVDHYQAAQAALPMTQVATMRSGGEEPEQKVAQKMVARRGYHVALHRLCHGAEKGVVRQAFATMAGRSDIIDDESFLEQDYHRSLPIWQGEEMGDDDILLLSFEQGYGDTIQFARFVRLLFPRVKNIFFEVPAPLLHLFSAEFNTTWRHGDEAESVARATAQQKSGAGNDGQAGKGQQVGAEILVFPYGAYDQLLHHPRLRHWRSIAAAVKKRQLLYALPHLLGLDNIPPQQPYLHIERLGP